MKLCTSMSLLAVLFAGILVTVPRVRAQAPKAPAEAMATLKQWSTDLNLTEAQKKQLLPVVIDEGQKMKDLKDDTTSTRLQKLMKLRAIHQDTDAKVKPIMTADQFTKFQALRQQNMEKMLDKMMERKAPSQ